ncbi:peptide/nickel transport system substrate-binding protein [Allocatelliglobosispora scoriae]|uniref:Peptide/nickel transport system substrate-binding protein n=1 Tax=Allocatelliglobosispora scoriae TaxID=643052 RepID=A0A841BPM2_9ACTN|nr:ABC transporter substrate-binding protein [Allocatelliglobosispora scoriae]MBB5869246.1 peptide/nickel transport system substrate-binding protein [Allocatelliglobosispora scoriae]
MLAPRHGARRTRRFAGAATALLFLVAACDSAAATDQAKPASQGGTLRVVVANLPDHLDPQKITAATDANISRLLTRSLTTFKSEPGSASSELVPDLATDVGRPSQGNRVWEFKLRDNVKWQDGTAINCSQLKYGVERNFIKDGDFGSLRYALKYLENPGGSYQGPLFGTNNEGAGLASVECLDARTIQYRLKQPVGDFGYVVALSEFSPVPQAQDGLDRAKYDLAPFSNGPYKVAPRTGNKQLTLVRNEFWSRDSDTVRKAFPDKVVIDANPDVAAVTNAIIADQGEDASTVMLDNDVAPNFVQQVVNDPDLSARTAGGLAGSVRYFAINTKTVPDLICRQALVYAFNKRRWRTAVGGAIMGELATTMIPPSLAAHKEFDLYNTAANPDGDPTKASELLDQAEKSGKTCPKKLKIAYRNQPQIVRYMKTVVEAYMRLNIQVEAVPVSSAGYWNDISDSGGPYHMLYAGWVPDFPNGSAVMQPLFDGSVVQRPGVLSSMSNYSFLQDEDVNKRIDDALAEPDLSQQYLMWGELDQKIAELAVVVPVMYPKALRLYGSNVTGAFIHSQFGQPDLSALGLINAGISGAA